MATKPTTPTGFLDPQDLEEELKSFQDVLDHYGRHYRGTVQRLHLKRGHGTVKAYSGKVYEFSAATVYVGGAVSRLKDVKPGMAVTFDLAQTEHGPRISRLWIGALKPIPEAVGLTE